MTDLLAEVTAVVRDVFADEDITLSESSMAADIDGWDSLMHLNVVIALEKRFGVRFTTGEIAGLKEEGKNIGSLLELIGAKQRAKP